MGIPRFFKKIVQQYPDTTMSIKEVSQIDYFFIDFNAMIYNVYEVFRKEHKLVNMKEYETKLIIAVCDYVKEMVHTIDPKKQLYFEDCDSLDSILDTFVSKIRLLHEYDFHDGIANELKTLR